WRISWSCFEGPCWNRQSQPHATAGIPKPRVSAERAVLRFAANRRRQIDIALLERSPQPGHGLLTLAEYDVLAGEGDRWNESAFRSRPQPLEGSGGSEHARRGVAGAAPAPTDETPECGVAPLAGARRKLVQGCVVVSLAGEGLRELIVGRRINRVERELLRELHSRVCRTTSHAFPSWLWWASLPQRSHAETRRHRK